MSGSNKENEDCAIPAADQPRERPLSFKLLMENYETIVKELNDLIESDEQELGENPHAIKNHIQNIKSCHKEFLHCSRSLSGRYVSLGSYEERQKVQKFRRELSLECQESIASLNLQLKDLSDEQCSNLSYQSLGSSLYKNVASLPHVEENAHCANTEPNVFLSGSQGDVNVSSSNSAITTVSSSIPVNVDSMSSTLSNLISRFQQLPSVQPTKSNCSVTVSELSNVPTTDASYNNSVRTMFNVTNDRISNLASNLQPTCPTVASSMHVNNELQSLTLSSNLSHVNNSHILSNSFVSQNSSHPRSFQNTAQHPVTATSVSLNPTAKTFQTALNPLQNKIPVSTPVTNQIHPNPSPVINQIHPIPSPVINQIHPIPSPVFSQIPPNPSTISNQILPNLSPAFNEIHSNPSPVINQIPSNPSSAPISSTSFISQNSCPLLENANLSSANINAVPNHNISQVIPQSVPPSSFNQSSFSHVLSQQVVAKELFSNSIQKFDGTSYNFWSWIGQIKGRIEGLSLTPLQILHLLETYTTGAPKQMIHNHLVSTGMITNRDVQEVWITLVERYGTSSKIASQLLDKLKQFPSVSGINSGEQLNELYDLCKIIEFNLPNCQELQKMNTSEGTEFVRAKLPVHMQIEWRRQGQHFENAAGYHPPFSYFLDFLRGQAREQCNSNYELLVNSSRKSAKVMLTSQDNTNTSGESSVFCPFHKSTGHHLQDCKSFGKLKFEDKRKKVFDLKLCFKCLEPHKVADCTSQVKCAECSGSHATVMHRSSQNVGPSSNFNNPHHLSKSYNSNTSRSNPPLLPTPPNKQIMCTKLCNDASVSRNCSKTVLVELTMKDRPNKKLLCYAIIDEQSDVTLVDDRVPAFFEKSFPTINYSLKFASDQYEVNTLGQIVTGLIVKGVNETKSILLPETLTSSTISDTRNQVATPSMVFAHSHIAHLAGNFPPFNKDAEVLLLIGRDCGSAMATNCYGEVEPFAHKTPLGWALVGQTCIKDRTKTRRYHVFKTSVQLPDHVAVKFQFPSKCSTAFDTFEKRKDDDILGLSREDQKFIDIVSSEICITEKGSIQMPIPLKKDVTLPNNKCTVFQRTKNTLLKLKKDTSKLTSCLNSMEKSITAGHVEKVPPDELNPDQTKACWLPIFPVEHPKKKKVRLVFDASAKFGGVSLNDALLQGPDMTNNIRGVLLRFRERPVGFVTDIEAMFNSFTLPPKDKDLYRFFWFEDNDSQNKIIQYRSTCHIFGSRSSPAIANYGLKYTAAHSQSIHDDVDNFINNAFYVDDGVYCSNSPTEAINIIRDARILLGSYNIHLHKIMSSHQEVLEAFPASETASGTHSLSSEEPSVKQTLGTAWDTSSDAFVMLVNIPEKPFTKSGILSTVNSIYDPMGIASPVSLAGRLIQREIISPKLQETDELSKCDWDDPLPDKYAKMWENWKSSLSSLANLSVNRCFRPSNFGNFKFEIHVFADASDRAIGHVCYMRSINEEGDVHVAFIMGDSKVAPKAATSIPRLELCAAMEAARCATKLTSEFELKPEHIYMYSDSQVILGYITNKERRFTKYVSRRVQIILEHTSEDQWNYIPTKLNPADISSRPSDPVSLSTTCWLKGPDFLWQPELHFQILDVKLTAESLPEVVCETKVLHTDVSIHSSIFDTLFTRSGSWLKVLAVGRVVLSYSNVLDRARQRLGIALAPRPSHASDSHVISTLIKNIQHATFPEVIKQLKTNKQLPEHHKISELAPFLDSKELLRVGGRLTNADIPFNAKHPILLPANHAVSNAILHHYHRQVGHQGRHITHGAIRQAGYHLQNGRHLINKLIRECVLCRKMRAPTMTQQMAPLPADRVASVPPFTNTGIDVFGPFLIHDGISTRKTTATKKVWVLICVCLCSRAVHLEMLPHMDTSSFRNALRRFIAIRGTCKLLRSDQGSNFTCAKRQFESIDICSIQNELKMKQCEWKLNPPGASHFGGCYERKIGSIRRVLEASLLLMGPRSISRDEFSTLIQEAGSIVNNTPMWEVSSSPDDPTPLSPAMLITLRDFRDPVSTESFSEADLLSYGKLRWRRSQYLADSFWSRWRNEYLHTLQKRHKWLTVKPCITPGDLVLIRDKTSKRNNWPSGIVSEVHKSSDNLVRSVTLKTTGPSSRKCTRAISDLVLLMPSKNHPC